MRDNLKMKVLANYRTLIILFVVCVFASFLSPAFLSVRNFGNVARQVSITAILAAGMTFVIITGGIDLSVGSVLAASGAVGAGILATTDNMVLTILITLLVGIVFGLLNGFLITKFSIPPFIATLATMVIARGVTLVYTKGYPIVVRNTSFQFLGRGMLLGLHIPIWIMILVYGLGYGILRHTRFGRHVYSTGGSEEASTLSGINVTRIKIGVYTISGFLAAVTALILTARLSSAQPTAGTGMELDAIAAVILGGTSLSGGLGSITGTVVGAFIMGVLDNILNLVNVNPFYQNIVKGVVIILAVITDGKFKNLSFNMAGQEQSKNNL